MKLIQLILMFLILSSLLVISNNEISFSDEGEFEFFVSSVGSLLSGFFHDFLPVTFLTIKGCGVS